MTLKSGEKIITSNVEEIIIKWMRSFINSGLGFRQEAVDRFSTTDNSELYNKIVMFVINSLKKIGIEPDIDSRGLLVITPAMLNKLKNPEDFTPELYDFLFDDRLAGIKYDDKDVVAVLTKNFKRIRQTRFNELATLVAFAKYGNFPAVEWYLQTYGHGYLRLLEYTPATFSFNYLVKFDEMKTIDVFYDFLKDRFDSYRGKDGEKLEFTALNLSLEGIKRILPLFQFKGTSQGYVWLFSDFNSAFNQMDKSLFNLLDLSEEEWKNLALITRSVTKFGKFDVYRKTIEGLNAVSDIYVQTLMAETDWKHHEEYVKTIPDVAELFLF